MRMKTLFLCLGLVGLVLADPALASYERFDSARRPAPGSQQTMPELQIITTPVLASTNAVLTATGNTSTSATKTVTTGITNPDVPRNITVTTGGSTGDCAAGNVVITGKDFFGHTLTENLAITNAQSGTTTGNKAFKSVSSIVLPAEQISALCTFAVGYGSKLGLNRCMDQAGYVIFASLDGVYETTRPTVAASASTLASNTVTLNGTLNGSKDVGVLFLQNYRCLP